ncbi:hypothetical protein ACOME3_001123 [Neoechinorhynchus agilis]
MKYLNLFPGGRIREVYNRDSYWIVKCAVQNSRYRKKIILNRMDSVIDPGFVINGGRGYHTTRSQPPVFTLMAIDFYEKTFNKGFEEPVSEQWRKSTTSG